MNTPDEPEDVQLAPGLHTHCVKDKAAIGSVEVQGFYDGVAYFQCPRCFQVWGRDGRPRASSKDVHHPVNRLLTLGDWAAAEDEKKKALGQP